MKGVCEKDWDWEVSRLILVVYKAFAPSFDEMVCRDLHSKAQMKRCFICWCVTIEGVQPFIGV